MTEEINSHELEAPSAGGPARRVILLPDPLRPPLPALALALAGDGHSLVLWSTLAGPGLDEASDALLDLQLAIGRAGGISLGVAGAAGLAMAAQAFGRIDLAVALGAAEAARLSGDAARLERERRPGVVMALRSPSSGSMEPALPEMTMGGMKQDPGPRVLPLDAPEPGAAAEEMARVARRIAGTFDS